MGKTFTQSLTSRFWKLAPAIFTLPPDVLEAESACMGMSQLVPPPLRGVITLSPAFRCVDTRWHSLAPQHAPHGTPPLRAYGSVRPLHQVTPGRAPSWC